MEREGDTYFFLLENSALWIDMLAKIYDDSQSIMSFYNLLSLTVGRIVTYL